MRTVGYLLMFYGVLAIVLGFANMVPRFVFWIYNWGESTAWIIKIGLVVVGLIIWLLGRKKSE